LGPLIRQEVKELLIESDVFLFPSYTEGFANAMLEAMASGLPIITTPVGANVDMIESMGGVIVEVGNSNSVIEAIDNINNSSVRSKMSEWNLNKVNNEYTIEKVMNKLISLYLYEVNK
jgi:glycosyltransferase involved in cell wall biosynthesis